LSSFDIDGRGRQTLLNPLNTEVSDDSRPVVRAGAWLFRQRTWIPLPLALALLLIPPEGPPSWFLTVLGFALVASGELLRVWAVRHIGAISRTRSSRLGPLVQTGPFAFVRNPLYLGNIALWVGFATSAGLLWLIPVLVVVLALEYHAIVQWEEQLLELRRGDEYKAYATRVPRWVPSLWNGPSMETESREVASWRGTLFSERGTLIAIGVGYFLLWTKIRLS
jgi:protein-S-isoprenylcysteine O-methyltransferase Ste14